MWNEIPSALFCKGGLGDFGSDFLSTAFHNYTYVFILLFIKFLGMISLKEVNHAKEEPIYHRTVCR
jgi:hypothetical protein